MKKPKILILSDDLRTHSGVARVSFDLVLNSLDRFDWVQVGAVIKHPEKGKRIDLSQQLKQTANYSGDCSVVLYPYDSYGDAGLVKYIIEKEKIDGILHFTDPRQFTWLYHIEHEIRQNIPIMYYHVWDNYPQCDYNKAFYESCDNIMCISKLTYDIVNDVLTPEMKSKMNIEYIPHGINDTYFHKIVDNDKLNEFKQKYIGSTDFDFIVLNNNRNIPRKNIPDLIHAFAQFNDTFSKEKAEKNLLLLKTDAFDPNGTNLYAVRDVLQKSFVNPINMHIISNKLSIEEMNLLYNISDVTVNIAGQEGWGLSSTESIMSETMIINNITGGLQDQCGFKDTDGNWVGNIVNKQILVKSHGDWCVSIMPTTRTIIGSQPTPYIYDDRIEVVKIVNALDHVYNIPKKIRNEFGKRGREFAIENGLTVSAMTKSIGDSMLKTINNFIPRNRFELIKL